VSHDGTIRHRQIATGDLVNDKKQAARKDFIHAGQVAFSPDNTRLAVCDEYALSLKDLETGEVITRIDFQGNSIGTVDFTPDSQTLIVFMKDFVRFIDASTGLERSSLKTPREWTGSFAFSCDGKYIAWGETNSSPPQGLLSSLVKFLDLEWEEDTVRIQDLAVVLNSGEKRRHEAKTEAAKGLLEAEIIVNQQSFDCSLGGRTAEEFSDLIGSGDYPPGPRVNLIFKLRNVSNQKVTLFNPDKKLSTLYLFGPGAMNLPLLSSQQFAPFGLGGPSPEYLTLGPGDSYSFSVANLAGSWDFHRYWLIPGEYTVRALYSCCVSPAPEGAFKIGDGFGSISIWTTPLKINVVASK
jgi:hypothetical protein